jgi:hypothetical protein
MFYKKQQIAWWFLPVTACSKENITPAPAWKQAQLDAKVLKRQRFRSYTLKLVTQTLLNFYTK